MSYVNINYMDKEINAINPNNASDTIKCGKLENIKKSTEEFFTRNLGNLMFSTDINRMMTLEVLYTGDNLDEFDSLDELMSDDEAKDSIILHGTDLSRIDYIYNSESPSESKEKRFYKEIFLDYSYLLRMAEVYDIEFYMSSNEKNYGIFVFGWKDKDKFTEIEVGNANWVPQKKMCK